MDYKNTLNLPKTEFPMKANLSQREPVMLKKWQEMKLYHLLRDKRKGAKKYILHDGPPYANGDVHLGTAFNKVLKDMIMKYKTMQGFDAPYVPGWDCHGMPIEHQVVKQLRNKKMEVTQVELRKLCREYATKYQKLQSEQFQRLGVLGDFDNSYLTMHPEYEAKILEVFGKLANEDYIYHGLKPILWCTECQTALAEAELEYEEDQSPSIYVKFELLNPPALIKERVGGGHVYLVIWTTTPWTLPANLGITVHPTFDYSIVNVGEEYLIIAKELVEQVMKTCDIKEYQIGATFKGAKLEKLKAVNPLNDKDSLIMNAEFVKLDTGTGCVHTAPGHGQDDYVVGQKYGLEPFCPVNERGIFTKDAGQWEGQYVFKANPLIVEFLKQKGALLHSDKLTHSYPHCWRCRKPLIFRATRQWFLNVDNKDLRQRTLKQIDSVKWIPDWGHDKIFNLVSSRPDWCVSRQRAWGVPIPSLYCAKCDHGWLPLDHYDSLLNQVRQHGVDVWFSSDLSQLFPGEIKCPKCGNAELKKEQDILDVWFDSGCSWSAVLQQRNDLSFPADIYLEAGDQHRGWFQVSLLPSVALEEKAPYRSCATHGLILDAEGKKMSKSIGNVIAPEQIIQKYGADVLRLWFSSVDFTTDVRLSDKIIEPIADAYFKYRNTARFLLGNLSDFDSGENTVPYEKLLPIDKWALHRLQRLISECTDAYDAFDFHRVYSKIYNFLVVDMSSIYLDILKDRLYTFAKNSNSRRAGQTVMFEIANTLTRLMAPQMPYTSDEIWVHLHQPESSVHLADFPKVNAAWVDESIEKEWEILLILREEVTKALEFARKEKKIGHPLDARILLLWNNAAENGLLKKFINDFPALFIVSQVSLVENIPSDTLASHKSDKIEGLEIGVVVALGKKCDRCWNYSERVGENAAHPTLCERCIPVVMELEK